MGARYLLVALFATFAAIIVGCGGGGDAPLNESRADVRRPNIVVIGDSITAGYMPTDATQEELVWEQAWPQDLKAIGQVYGAPVGGATTAAALANQTVWLSGIKADVVVIMLGTNDAVYAVPPEQSVDNVRQIADKWPSAKLVLMSPPTWTPAFDLWMADYTKRLAQLAKDRGAQFVDVFAASAPAWQCNPFNHHPCANAHREFGRMATAAVLAALR